MLQLLVKVVFFIISGIANILLTPLLSIITTIIPDITPAINAILTWVTTALTAVPFILKLLCVPLEAVSFFFGFWVLVFGVSAGVRAIVFIKNIYYELKP